ELMIEAGLEAEAKALYPLRHLNALQTVGYKELFEWFDGTTSREEAIELIKRNSRRYAKRQMTWFRRDEAIHWIERNSTDQALEIIKNL
ncbi:MAG: tRNA (adenosine(37)-N6)-dimethylallyltransferase MiaA, partial [Tidjanibacter sp.]|nr:tRNA (adenosine(37)-N6)-dimethylallyltransferase MiaA [Tidjanibacter sp.]